MSDVAFKPSMAVHGAAGEALRIPRADYKQPEAVDCWIINLTDRPSLRFQLMCVTGGRRGVYALSLWQTDLDMAADLRCAGLDDSIASCSRDNVVLELASDAMGRYVTRAVANMVARGALPIHDGHTACVHWCEAVQLIAALKAWETSGLT